MKLRIMALIVGVLATEVTTARAATLTHVIILVRDMQTGRHAFAAAGFNLGPTNPISRGLLHAVIPFRDGTFLELIAALPHSSYAKDVGKYVKHGDVLSSAGFEVANVYAEAAALRARGFRVDPLERSPHWIDLSFSEPAGMLEPFFLYQYRGDYGTRALRKYARLAESQPYGAIGIRGIDVAVEPGQKAEATYAAAGLRGVTAVERGAGDATITVVSLATSDPRRKGTMMLIDRCRIRYE